MATTVRSLEPRTEKNGTNKDVKGTGKKRKIKKKVIHGLLWERRGERPAKDVDQWLPSAHVNTI
jgi:hypothetical protein